MNQHPLPVGISAFRNIRRRGFYYVDKTPHLHQLIEEGEYWFLSRPRRFGKTLLVDTLHELFAGSEDLFRGLSIHPRWDWQTTHPVVRLSFGGTFRGPDELDKDILRQLHSIERRYQLDPDTESDTGPTRLRSLIDRLQLTTDQQVVVLVDEYDKPILDVLETPELALAHRDTLRGLYGMLKDCARWLRFVFVTGISMYSKVSLFSNLNNLNDLSLMPRYATICGYTETDLDTVFAPELEGVSAEDRDKIRHWYNGYSWRGQETVYNPFDILLYFQNREFQPYWYETGTPSYLYHRLARGDILPQTLSRLDMSRGELSRFNLENLSVNALLFQCGYLTMVGEQHTNEEYVYTLDYPNEEVRRSLNRELLESVLGDWATTLRRRQTLTDRLLAQDFDGFEQALQAFFAGIPHTWQDPGELFRWEGFYVGLLYAAWLTQGLDIRGEEVTHRGRSDLVLIHRAQVFVFECKVAQGEVEVDRKLDDAMAQMREKGYADKYRTPGKEVHRLGLVFDQEQRNLAALRAERV